MSKKGNTDRSSEGEKDPQNDQASFFFFFRIQVKSLADQSSEDLRWFTVKTSST